MHTLIVTFVGFVLLGGLIAASRRKNAAAARFISVWLVLCLIHFGFGVWGARDPLTPATS